MGPDSRQRVAVDTTALGDFGPDPATGSPYEKKV
jgi:hypothetical protein